MTERKWTLMVVPDGSGASRVFSVSRTLLKVALSGALTFVLLALILGYATVARSVDLSRAAQLKHENDVLAEQLSQMQGRLSLLSDTLGAIAQRDSKIRLLANLEPTDPQVLRAGIGGPTPASARRAESSSPVVAHAADIRVDLNGLIRRANLLAFSFKEAADSLSAHTERLEATPSIMPTQGWLTSAFSAMRDHPILHVARPHEGIDVTAPMGTPIEAPAAGRVIQTGWETGYGNTVTIDHGYGLTTKFAHASKILVRNGQRVARGDRIALVGNSGLATAPHLHYEVHVNGRPVNPLRYVLPDAIVD